MKPTFENRGNIAITTGIIAKNNYRIGDVVICKSPNNPERLVFNKMLMLLTCIHVNIISGMSANESRQPLVASSTCKDTNFKIQRGL